MLAAQAMIDAECPDLEVGETAVRPRQGGASGRATARETDSPLEEDGFELPVPPKTGLF